MEREVIIVGAGPGGSTAAMALAQKGRDVLLIDRQTFPRDKTCGDAIPGGAVEKLYKLGMEERFQAANFYVANRLLLSSPREYVLEADLAPGPLGANSYIAPRMAFDHLLQEHALESGAEFCQARVKEPILEDGRVVGVRAQINGKSQEIRARLVIGADGVTSVIARALRPEKLEDKHRAVALRVYVEDIEILPSEVEFYLFKDILPGYAWIFPTSDNEANVGLGMRLDKFRTGDRSLENLLDEFLEMPVIKKRLHPGTKMRDMATWQLNFGSQKNLRRAFDGALLVGDAAGMINPLTGGGIHNAVLAGVLAADTTHKALSHGDMSYAALQEYEVACHERMWPDMKRSFLIQRTLLFLPTWVDILVRWGSSSSNLAQTFIDKL